jgi:nucleotide-binding universal stress UspA family protein
MAGAAPLLVGFDGSDSSRHALDFALREAALREAPVVVLVVAAVRYESVSPYDPGTIDIGLIPPITAEGPVEIQPLLREARGVVEESGIDGSVEWSLGDPVTEILRVAEERGAAAIVVGSSHHSALGRLFGADTTAALVRDAPCDVLVAH